MLSGFVARAVSIVISIGATDALAQSPVASPAPIAAPSGIVGLPIIAGWHNDLFYLSDPTQNYFLIPTGRLQADFIGIAGNNASNDYTTNGVFHRADVRNTFLLRRARIELAGGFLKRYTFFLSADFTGASAPIAFDVYANARVVSFLNFQIGQFSAPLTLENRTSDNYTDFIERSLAVRTFAIPNNREIGLMAWGETDSRVFAYQVGMFNGDGQNRLNRDSYFDFIGRIFGHPLITLGGPLADLQVGGSFRFGGRGASVDYPISSMTTPGGYTFFNPQIVSGTSPVTIVPDANQIVAAGEIDLPIRRFDFRAEYVWAHGETAEMAALATDAAHLQGSSLRRGAIEGSAYYVQLGYWLWGTPAIGGRPGYQNPPQLRLDRPDPPAPPTAIQLLARLDVVDFKYFGGNRSASSAPNARFDGTYRIVAAEFGVNFWATKHVRLALNYTEFFFPGQPSSPAPTTVDENHLRGPHENVGAYGEIIARVALSL